MNMTSPRISLSDAFAEQKFDYPMKIMYNKKIMKKGKKGHE